MDMNKAGKARLIFFGIAFFLLTFSFYSNLFKVAVPVHYKEYETFEEGLVIGRMVKAEKDGFFASSGFMGVNYIKPDSVKDALRVDDLGLRDSIVSGNRFDQIRYYLGEKDAPDGYCVYVSHSGGQASLYYLIQKILPFSNDINYQILRFLNAMLMAMGFLVFTGWVLRNFGITPAIITFLFTFLSPKIVMFGGNGLWWSLWNFYVPFLALLLLLEKRYSSPGTVSDRRIFVSLFLAVLVKFFFSGLEFSSTAMLSIFIPIVYYSYLERQRFAEFFVFSFKAGLAALGAVLVQFLVLILQLWTYLGGLGGALGYLQTAFVRRSSFVQFSDLEGTDNDPSSLSFVWNNVIKYYLGENSSDWGFTPVFIRFRFVYLIFIIIVCTGIVWFLTRKLHDRKYVALILATLSSVVCPLSWYIIFKEHAFWHIQLDVIVWYMPFLLLGFAVIGTAISLLMSGIKRTGKL